MQTFHTTPDWPTTGGSFPRNSNFAGLESVLPKQFHWPVDRSGHFEVPDVPAGGRIYLLASGPGLGFGGYANVGRGYVPISDTVTIEMHAEAILRGTVQEPWRRRPRRGRGDD